MQCAIKRPTAGYPLAARSLSDQQKDLEILLLRHQLRILQRTLSRSPSVSKWAKGILAILAAQFRYSTKGTRKRLDEAFLLFKPDTVLRWHRQMVRRKWTFRRAGRPLVVIGLQELIVRLATENSRWGHSKIEGELLKLGYKVSRSSVRNVLRHRHSPVVCGSSVQSQNASSEAAATPVDSCPA